MKFQGEGAPVGARLLANAWMHTARTALTALALSRASSLPQEIRRQKIAGRSRMKGSVNLGPVGARLPAMRSALSTSSVFDTLLIAGKRALTNRDEACQ